MKNIYMTIYTKDHGILDLTREEYNNFTLNTVTFHRTDGPAVIRYYKDGSVECEYYYINNKWHRLGSPSSIWYYRNGNIWREYYNIDDKHHRLDGPSIIWYYQDGSFKSEYYYINDNWYTKEDYDNLINEMKALPKSLRLVHELWWVREL